MIQSLLFIGVLLITVLASASAPGPPLPSKKVPLEKKNDGYTCGTAKITTKTTYCTVFKKCDTAGIVHGKDNRSTEYVENEKTFALCAKSIQKNELQLRVDESPDVWKKVKKISCEQDPGGNTTVQVTFVNDKLEFNKGKKPSEFALRCISSGRARFDIYDNDSGRTTVDENDGLYYSSRVYLVYLFISLLVTLTVMSLYYVVYLSLEIRKLERSVVRRQNRHDELWLTVERSKRTDEDDMLEVWNAMPLIHQQVALEAALFLQKYKTCRFTPELRQWIIDRGYPAGATEIILHVAGLNDGFLPFFAPEERLANYKNNDKLEEFGERIESRIVDTLNYANRLRRRKVVFTDHRWLELHHLLLELLLTCLGSPSHPTIHDADIPVLPRHAFGTRDDPREEEKERENAVRNRKPHFLHYDWDEAQRLMGSEA